MVRQNVMTRGFNDAEVKKTFSVDFLLRQGADTILHRDSYEVVIYFKNFEE